MTQNIPSRKVRACTLIDPHDGHVRSTGSWCPGVDEDDETGMHDPESPDFDPDVRDQDVEREAALAAEVPAWEQNLGPDARRIAELEHALTAEQARTTELVRDLGHLQRRNEELEVLVSHADFAVAGMRAEKNEARARIAELERDVMLAAHRATITDKRLAEEGQRLAELERKLNQNQQDYRVAREWITELEDQPVRTQLRERDAQLAEALELVNAWPYTGAADLPALRPILTRHLP